MVLGAGAVAGRDLQCVIFGESPRRTSLWETPRPGRMNAPGKTEPTEAIARARAGDAEALGRALPGIRTCDVPVSAGVPCRLGKTPKTPTMEIFMKLKVKLVQYDATRSFSAWLYKVAANHCWGHPAAAQDSPGQGNGRFGKCATGASGPKPTGDADRAAQQRRSPQGTGQNGPASAHGAGDALLLGYELRRDCG